MTGTFRFPLSFRLSVNPITDNLRWRLVRVVVVFNVYLRCGAMIVNTIVAIISDLCAAELANVLVTVIRGLE